MSKHNVVIVGGGFGGVKTALLLAKDERFRVSLISDYTHMRIYGALYHTATGGSRRVSSIPLSEIFAGHAVHLLHDKVVNLDRQKRLIKTKVGHTLPYDALILAMGVGTNYFGIKGLEKYSFGIKSLEDAEELKNHLHKQLVKENHQDLNYVVVGGGPTGVELAGALPDYIRQIVQQHGLPKRKIHVDLIEASPRLLPRMPKDISRLVARRLRKIGVKIYLNTAVQAQNADALMVNDKPIRSHTVIWTAGMTNNPFFTEQHFQLAKNGKVRVDQFMQAEQGIYVLGDNADTPYSGMAQTALYDGHYVAENLIRLADNDEPQPYHAKKPIYVMPAGPEWAAVLWGKFRLYGRLGWALRRLADLIAYHDYEPWNLAVMRFAAEAEKEESCPQCADGMTQIQYLSGEV
ncbi:FAD-dependent oxidoreductase [Candidatus Saccharibacteria bacterium]|nr:FAD-dependent oxidoreductase [Candidatus Saccharibacteria bacterium]